MSLQQSSIYRHFKGGYYIVHSIAFKEEDRDEQVVVYQSLQDGRVWTRPLSSFLEPVPEGKENPTGQKMRFERVTDFNNQLNLIPTDKLMSELLSRSDCPPELQTLNPDKVWMLEYLIGSYREEYISQGNYHTEFYYEGCADSLEEAKEKLEKMNDPRLTILMRVHIKQDFD